MLRSSEFSVLCRSLNSTKETNLELDGSMGQRKPPRKERKKTAYVRILIVTSIVELVFSWICRHLLLISHLHFPYAFSIWAKLERFPKCFKIVYDTHYFKTILWVFCEYHLKGSLFWVLSQRLGLFTWCGNLIVLNLF